MLLNAQEANAEEATHIAVQVGADKDTAFRLCFAPPFACVDTAFCLCFAPPFACVDTAFRLCFALFIACVLHCLTSLKDRAFPR